MRIYLDDCAFSHQLLRLFQDAGFDAQAPADVALTGADAEVHFEHARPEQRAIITKNPSYFLALHQVRADHSGVLAVYQDNDSRDMSYAEVVQAVQNVLRDDPQGISGRYIILNQWRY